jgi:hypothetical protein
MQERWHTRDVLGRIEERVSPIVSCVGGHPRREGVLVARAATLAGITVN